MNDVIMMNDDAPAGWHGGQRPQGLHRKCLLGAHCRAARGGASTQNPHQHPKRAPAPRARQPQDLKQIVVTSTSKPGYMRGHGSKTGHTDLPCLRARGRPPADDAAMPTNVSCQPTSHRAQGMFAPHTLAPPARSGQCLDCPPPPLAGPGRGLRPAWPAAGVASSRLARRSLNADSASTGSAPAAAAAAALAVTAENGAGGGWMGGVNRGGCSSSNMRRRSACRWARAAAVVPLTPPPPLPRSPAAGPSCGQQDAERVGAARTPYASMHTGRPPPQTQGGSCL